MNILYHTLKSTQKKEEKPPDEVFLKKILLSYSKILSIQ